MNHSERQFVSNTICTIQDHIMGYAQSESIRFNEEKINAEFAELERIASQYNKASDTSKSKLWTALFRHLEYFFDLGDFVDATEEEQIPSFMAIGCCLILEKESSEFAKLFLDHQEQWDVVIRENSSEGNTLH